MQAEALRWLGVAEKKLSARDLLESRSFATRARAADPNLRGPDEIIAVVDTLLAGDKRIGIHHPDWYSILRITRHLSRDRSLVDRQYRLLSHLLNPQTNQFPFADQAFHLVVQAWNVLSDPARKSLYDKELALHRPGPFSDPNPAIEPVPSLQHSVLPFSRNTVAHFIPWVDPTREISNPPNFPPDSIQSQTITPNAAYNQDQMQQTLKFNVLTIQDQNMDESSFWTMCPNCYYMYEYLRAYVDSTVYCQNCLKGFKPVIIPMPYKKDGYLPSWGRTPIEVSMVNGETDKIDAITSTWMPFCPSDAFPQFDSTGNYDGIVDCDLASFMENDESLATTACREAMGIETNVLLGSGLVPSMGSSSEWMFVDDQSKNSSDVFSSANGIDDQSLEYVDTMYSIELEELCAIVNLSNEPILDLEDEVSIEKWFA